MKVSVRDMVVLTWRGYGPAVAQYLKAELYVVYCRVRCWLSAVDLWLSERGF